MDLQKMSIIGLVEKVIFNKETQLNARIDTGATMSSIDIKLAHELGFKKKVRQIKVRNAHGRSVRDIVLIQLNISGILIKEEFSLADRSHMRYQVLIGQNILNKGFFLINPKLKN